MTNPIDWLCDNWSRFANGGVDHITICACEDERDRANTLRNGLLGEGYNCRIIIGDTLTMDDEDIALTSGSFAIVTAYTGGALRGPHYSTAIARTNA